MSHKSIAITTFLFLFATNGYGQTFIDNFDRVDLFDGNPVQWVINPGQEENASITDENLIVSDVDAGEDPVLVVEGDWKDVTIQTQFRMLTLGNGTFAGIYGRSQQDPPGPFYGTAINDAGGLFMFEGFEDKPFESVAFAESGLDQSTFDGDVVLRLDIQGDTITATAWAAESPEDVTELTYVDDSIKIGGNLGLTVASEGAPGSVAFRSYSVVPEPSCSMLMLIGIISLARLTRTRTRLSHV